VSAGRATGPPGAFRDRTVQLGPSDKSYRAVRPVIVVGFNDSESSWDALWWAFGQAQRQQASVVATLVSPATETSRHIASAAVASSFGAHVVFEQLNDEAEILRSKLEGHAIDNHIRFTFVRASGDAKNEILRVAVEHHADLIVIGKSAKVRHRFMGSVGRHLIGNPNSPAVVVVP
jgi:nucleotide-binding universal stress UspA family protein